MLNVFGLALGITISFWGLLYFQYESHYDKSFPEHDKIYRVSRQVDSGIKSIEVKYRLAELLQARTTATIGVISPVPDYWGYPLLRIGERAFVEKKIAFADPGLQDIFQFKFIEGDQREALTIPGSLIMTRSTAARYFGDEPAVGNQIAYQFSPPFASVTQNEVFQVTGVIEDLQNNSSLSFDILLPFTSMPDYQSKASTNTIYGNIYVKARQAQELQAVHSEFKHYSDNIVDASGLKTTMFLQSLEDIHWKELPGKNGAANLPQYKYLVALLIVCFVILVAACINYVNLSTAHASMRAGEVGIRKVLGESNKRLEWRFLSESLLVAAMATIIAAVFSVTFLPWFNYVVQVPLSMSLSNAVPDLLFFLLLFVFVGFCSGVYPAFFMSRLDPLRALKNYAIKGKGSLRKVLTVLQFGISAMLVVAVLVVVDQMRYIKNKELGITNSTVLYFQNASGLGQNPIAFETFKNELLSISNVKHVSGVWSMPGGERTPVFRYPVLPEGVGVNEFHQLRTIWADESFANTFSLSVIDGRGLSEKFATDSTDAMVLNETAVRAFGWEDNPIGKTIDYAWGKKSKVVGVIKDFNFRSLHHPVEPMAWAMMDSKKFQYTAVQLGSGDLAGAMKQIEVVWNKFLPEWPIEIFFLDQALQAQYEEEEIMMRAVLVLSVIALAIGCLGLLGLASFLTAERMKEVSIRKVLGATVGNLIKLLSMGLFKLMIVSFMIAFPLISYLMNDWLNGFAYRVGFSGWWLLLSASILLVVAFATVGFHMARTALVNPAVTLKAE